jgi:endonuclease YncB( thermonuclease family)
LGNGGMTKHIVLAAVVTAFAYNVAAASTVRVVDGDTIELSGITYRLHGIDAPEAGQKCAKANGGTWQCGKAAIGALEALAFSGTVECDTRGTDEYSRVIGVCTVDGKGINASMVEAGHAWAFRKFSNDYVEQEGRARGAKRGIWQADTQTAWEYRAARWEVGLQGAPEGCPIKGNISKNGRIYHAPWSPWYKRTKISPNKGERWFCSEAEALKAGWRAPYWGR